MLTPSFDLSQNDAFLIIVIKAPFAKVSETEIFIEEDQFRFYSKPYFLRLSLPGHIVEDGREVADYDVDKGTFTIKAPKASAGEHFEGLNMITKLLTPKGISSASQPLIEVLGGGSDKSTDAPEEEEDFDWYVNQEEFVESDVSLSSPTYGFANLKSGMFQRLQEELKEIVDLSNPDHVPVSERHLLRTAAEKEKFDANYYLADLYDDESVQEVIKYKACWENIHLDSSKHLQFSDREKDDMKHLPKKEYVIEESSLVCVYLGLVDIMFAYAYNHRTTQGENNVESDWTFCKLSATLSWFEVFHDVREVVLSCTRQSLCYPLYRNWQLTQKVLSDVQTILSLGKTQVLKCLLECREILLQRYPYYILNELYIIDYCVWIQSASEKQLKSLAETLHKVTVKKEDVGFHLCEVEEASKQENEEDIERLADSLSRVELNTKTSPLDKIENRDSDDESTESEYESSESDDNSTETDDENSHSDYENTTDESRSVDCNNENKEDIKDDSSQLPKET